MQQQGGYTGEVTTCKSIQFDLDYQSQNYTQQILRITEQGLDKILQNASDLADYVMSQTIFPDIFFNVSTMSFKFTNLHFTSVQIPIPNLAFYQEFNQIYLDFENAQAVVSFEFEMQQQIYPYISETGTGEFGIGQIDINTFMQFSSAEDCPGRLNIELQNFQLFVSDLIIRLSSKNSWLYQGILSLMGDLVADMFNSQLQSYFQEFIQDGTNEGLYASYAVFTPFDNNNIIGVDQRIINFIIDQQYMDMQQVGTYCYFQKDDSGQGTCTGHVMEEEESYELSINKPTNNDLQLVFGKEVFISMFQYFKQNDTIQQFISDCQNPQIVNTGLSITCTDKDNNQIDYHFISQMNYKDQDSSDLLVYLQLDNQQYDYRQEIDDALYYLATGGDFEYQFQFEQCWSLYSYDQYVSINCDV